MRNDFDIPTFFAGFSLCLVMICCLMYFNKTLPDQVANQYKEQAIRRGFAQYVVDTKGVVTFEWKEKK